MSSTLVACLSFVITLCLCIQFGETIDCFKCISMAGDNPSCDDPFHNNFSTQFFEAPCMGGRKGRDGLYPATSCIKITGSFADDESKLTVRSCALDSGTLTTDTEIVRMSHCGGFYYDGRYVRGCVQSCNDAEGCNQSVPISPRISIIILLLLVTYHGNARKLFC